MDEGKYGKVLRFLRESSDEANFSGRVSEALNACKFASYVDAERFSKRLRMKAQHASAVSKN